MANSSKGQHAQKELIKAIGRKMHALLKDKENLNNTIQEHIGCIEEYFRRYDTIQLLGSVGLYLIDNLPNIEKYSTCTVEKCPVSLPSDSQFDAQPSTPSFLR